MSEDRKQLLRDDDDDQDHLVPPNQNTSSSSKMPSTQWDMRTISLAVLTLQNAILGISMRKATTSEGSIMGFDILQMDNSSNSTFPFPGPMFINSTAVLMAEVVKLVVCLYLVFR